MHSMPRFPMLALPAALLMSALCGCTTTSKSADTAADLSPVQLIRKQARDVAPLVRSRLARDFLRAADTLPAVTARAFYRTAARTAYYTEDQFNALPADQRSDVQLLTLDEHYYYNTRYGTPIAYARAIELVAQAGLRDLRGRRLLDFGYGGIGHLRLLAACGADAVGVEVDPLLPLLYGQAGDQGDMPGLPGRPGGRVHLVHGRFPAEPDVVRAVGRGHHLFISKNVLKNGYIHPAQQVDPRMLVQLGVDEETFVRAMYDALVPGGYAMIYNLCPAPNPPDKPYIPWADGRCPFSRELIETTGFRVIDYNRDDSAAARKMGRALGWDQGEKPMDLEKDLFALYTLLERPPA